MHSDIISHSATSMPVESLAAWTARFDHHHIDLGTGDGTFARDLARRAPLTGVVGLDTCLDHLKGSRRTRPANLRFVIADAVTMPLDQLPVAASVSINFPYGSLLQALVDGDDRLLDRLAAMVVPGGSLVARVNASALLACGRNPATAGAQVAETLGRLPRVWVDARPLMQPELRAFPSSWAKRIGYGKPTAAFEVRATHQ